MAARIALAGLGLMGVPIAERLIAAGYDLTVYNRTPGKAEPLVSLGASPARDPAELLGTGGVCLTTLADDAALEAVVLGPGGILAGAAAGSTLVDLSTVSPSVSRRVASAAAPAGVDYLRAPVSGNPGVVRAGGLTIIVSGPRAVFDELRGLLTAIGPNLFHVGEGDEARIVKLALQIMIGGTAELLAEALTLAEASGVERGTLLEVMGGSAIGSPFVRYKAAPLVADDFSATFTTSMMLKDVDLVRALADESGVRLPVADELARLLADTAVRGHGDRDFTALLLRLREDAGLPLPPLPDGADAHA